MSDEKGDNACCGCLIVIILVAILVQVIKLVETVG